MIVRPTRLPLFFLLLSLFCASAFAQDAAPAKPLRFRIALAPSASAKATAGRLLVFMTDNPSPQSTLGVDFAPGAVWVAAQEVAHLAPGGVVEFNPDALAYPKPFSQAKPGAYQVMALLDPDHTYAYHGQDGGDLFSQVVKIENVTAAAAPIELTLSRVEPPAPKPADTENVKFIEFQSPLLTAFWGRPIAMRAGVVLPPSHATETARVYPTIYHVHGFGGDHTDALRQTDPLIAGMKSGAIAEMVHVFLDGSFSTGHHEFADSVNNGPWGRALTEELIPHLEKRFRLVPKSYGRFLTGHSSGGWSTLWLQVAYPDFFGGTWSTAPDPVDLRSFTGVDATPGSADNAYRTRDGKARNLVRDSGRDLATLEEFAKQEQVLGEYGGQFGSFEWVWSPRGRDGKPMKLFNRETGELDPEVTQAWRKYDIRLILDTNWTALEPKLRGKIHIFCGGDDTFHLEEAVILLRDFFKRKNSDAVCEIIPGRNHFTLFQPFETYPQGLSRRILAEITAKYEAEAKRQ
jgi:hypothetical protein